MKAAVQRGITRRTVDLSRAIVTSLVDTSGFHRDVIRTDTVGRMADVACFVVWLIWPEYIALVTSLFRVLDQLEYHSRFGSTDSDLDLSAIQVHLV